MVSDFKFINFSIEVFFNVIFSMEALNAWSRKIFQN